MISFDVDAPDIEDLDPGGGQTQAPPAAPPPSLSFERGPTLSPSSPFVVPPPSAANPFSVPRPVTGAFPIASMVKELTQQQPPKPAVAALAFEDTKPKAAPPAPAPPRSPMADDPLANAFLTGAGNVAPPDAVPPNPFATKPATHPFGGGKGPAANPFATPSPSGGALAAPSGAVGGFNPFASVDGPFGVPTKGTAGPQPKPPPLPPPDDGSFDPFAGESSAPVPAPPLTMDLAADAVGEDVPFDADDTVEPTDERWDQPTEKMQQVLPPGAADDDPNRTREVPLENVPTTMPPLRAAAALLADNDSPFEETVSHDDEPTVDTAHSPAFLAQNRALTLSDRLRALALRLDHEGQRQDAELIYEAAALLAAEGN